MEAQKKTYSLLPTRLAVLPPVKLKDCPAGPFLTELGLFIKQANPVNNPDYIMTHRFPGWGRDFDRTVDGYLSAILKERGLESARVGAEYAARNAILNGYKDTIVQPVILVDPEPGE